MIEDKLNTSQRIRLEALNQANSYCSMRPIDKDTFYRIVEDFEVYIRTGNVPALQIVEEEKGTQQ